MLTGNYEICLTDSLEKVRSDTRPRPMDGTRIPAWPGEEISFQVAFRAIEKKSDDSRFLSLSFEGEVADIIRCMQVVQMPFIMATREDADGNYLTKSPGQLPDALMPADPACIRVRGDAWQAVWCCLKIPADAAGKQHRIAVLLKNEAGERIFRQEIFLDVQPDVLPGQKLMHTEWFHADCLADYYGVEVWSEEHWRIIGNFMKAAADHGVNMLLTPLFTLPLDTAEGGERTTCQLLRIYYHDGHFGFDFSRLDRWIDLALSNGITELEMCHLFTQWGAAAAPKIMVFTDRTERQLFGWDIPSTSPEYTKFLREMLTALKSHLREMGLLEHTWFHISDEPDPSCLATWKAARDSVADLLEDCHVIDAMSSIQFYEEGLIKTPVVACDHLEPFVQAEIPGLWTYYCCSQFRDVPNRFIAMPSGRCRILGVLLYRYALAGFLHWGFNFYNSQLSLEHIDPWQTADGNGSWPAGDPFLVYPAEDGTAVESIRGMLIKEALQDLRLLQLAEEKLGRPAVLRLLENSWAGGTMTMSNYPQDPVWFQSFRSRIARALHPKRADAAVYIMFGQSNATGHILPMRGEDIIGEPLKNVFGLCRDPNQSYDNAELVWSGYTSFGMNLGETQDNTYSVPNCLARLWQDAVDAGEDLPDLYIVHISIGAEGMTEPYMWYPYRKEVLVSGELGTVNISLYPLAVHILSLLGLSFEKDGKTWEILGLHWRGGEEDTTEPVIRDAQKVKRLYEQMISGFRRAAGVQMPVILHNIVCCDRELDMDPTGRSLERMYFLNFLFEILAETGENIRVFDIRNAPQYDPDIRGNGIFLDIDVAHYTESVNRWVAQTVLDEYRKNSEETECER